MIGREHQIRALIDKYSTYESIKMWGIFLVVNERAVWYYDLRGLHNPEIITDTHTSVCMVLLSERSSYTYTRIDVVVLICDDWNGICYFCNLDTSFSSVS